MARKTKYGDITKVDIYRKSIPTSELKAIRRQYAKQVNQRLVRLERAKSTVTGESFDKMGAGVLIKAKLEELGRNRFSELMNPAGYNRRDIQREIIELKTFLDYKTSTVAGAKKVEIARLKAFESRGLGEVARSKDFYDFLNSESYKDLKRSSLTSDQIQDFYNRKYKEGLAPDEIQQLFDDYLAKVDKSPTGEITYKGLQKSLGLKGFK